MVGVTAPERELAWWDGTVRTNPQNPNAYIRRGMAHFKLAHIQEAIQDFDRAEALKPDLHPYLWQRGLAYYYASRYEEGALQFEADLQVNAQDVEETVWRYLCIARSRGQAAARSSLLTVSQDPRPVMTRVYNLFAGTCTPEVVLARGRQGDDRDQFYSHLYVGLYYEATHQPLLACQHLCRAAEQYVLDDYMWYLARVHCHLRCWQNGCIS